MLTCRGLRKEYVTERGAVAAVAGIDLEIAAGRYAAIIGRSGSGKSSATYARAAALLGQMGLGGHLDAYPSEVSAGEQRRAVIARALINEPALILADEPTSDLDEQTEIEIMDELLAVNRERRTTLVLVTHNLALAEQAEQIVHIAHGAIVA